MTQKKVFLGIALIILIAAVGAYAGLRVLSLDSFHGPKKMICETRGGQWKVLGNPFPQPPIGICVYATKDGGKPCTDSRECKSRCIAVNSEATSGKCAEWHPVASNGECTLSNGVALCWAF